jgi:hypothetical protein
MNWLEALDLMRAGKIVYPAAENSKMKVLHKMDGINVMCRPTTKSITWEPVGLYVADRELDWHEYKPYTDINPQEAFNRLMHNSSVDMLEIYSDMTQKWWPLTDWENMTLESCMKSKWRYCNEMV